MSNAEPRAFVLDSGSLEARMNRQPSWISRKPIPTRPPPPASSAPLPAEAPAPEAPELRSLPEVTPPPVFEPDPEMVAEIEQLRRDNAALQSRIADMAVTMARIRRDVLEASEPELVQLALSIAERVVRRELSADPGLLVTWAREALQALAAKDEVVIALAQDNSSQVPAEAWAGLGVEHRVETDPALASGSVEVRTREAVVAAGADAQLKSVAEALGVETT